MSKLPVVSGREVVRALGKVGYVLDRQKGSPFPIALPNQTTPHAIREAREVRNPIEADSLDALPPLSLATSSPCTALRAGVRRDFSGHSVRVREMLHSAMDIPKESRKVRGVGDGSSSTPT